MFHLRHRIFMYVILSLIFISCPDEIFKPPVIGGISGRVLDSETETVLKGASIVTNPATSAIVVDDSGRYELEEVLAGEYMVTASKSGYTTGNINVVVEGGKTAQAVFRLNKPKTDGMIFGSVIESRTSRPISGARIATMPATNVVMSDENGEYSIKKVPAGDYMIWSVKAGYKSSYKQDSIQVRVVAGDTSEAVMEMVYTDSTGVLKGSVIDRDTREGVKDVRVTTSPGSGVVMTDVEGHYQITSMNAGSYLLRVSKKGYTSDINVDSIRVNIQPKDTTEAILEVYRSETFGSIHGLVRDGESEQPVRSARLYTNPPSDVVISDDQGEFYFIDVPTGPYTIFAQKANYHRDSIQVSVASLDTAEAIMDLFRSEAIGHITGTISNRETNEVIAGVSVKTDPPTSVVTSNDLGVYLISEIPAEHYTVIAEKSGYASEDEAVTVTSSDTIVANIEMSRSEAQGTIKGVVRNGETSAPIFGARITTDPASSVVTTNDSGEYVISNLPVGSYSLSATKAGYLQDSVAIAVIADDTVEAAFELFPTETTGSISGAVRNGDTELPIAGVRIVTDPPTSAVLSDPQGQFSFPAVEPGDYTVIASKTGFTTDSIQIHVNAYSTTEAVVEMQRVSNIGHIVGIVQDVETGDPISGVRITSDPPTSSILSDLQGEFSLTGVFIGDYTLEASKIGYVTDIFSVTVTGGDTTYVITELQEAVTTGSISGVVRSGAGWGTIARFSRIASPQTPTKTTIVKSRRELSNKSTHLTTRKISRTSPQRSVQKRVNSGLNKVKTLQSAQVTTPTLSGGKVTSVTGELLEGVRISTIPATDVVLSDDAGTFLIDEVDPGAYTVLAQKAGFQPDSVQVNITAGMNSALVFELAPIVTTGAIQGIVQSEADGTVIFGANVTTTPPTDVLLTDPNGEFILPNIPEGNYTVTVTKSGFLQRQIDLVVDAGDTTNAVFEMTPEIIHGDITGIVRDADTGSPITGARITSSPPTDVLLSDQNGEFTFEQILADEYTIHVTKSGYLPDEVDVTVTAGEISEITLEITRDINTGVIEGLVHHAIDNTPLANANITTSPATSSIQSDSIGQYTLRNVAVGDYTISVSKSGFVTRTVDVTVTSGDTTSAYVELTPSLLTGSITGTITNGADGAPVNGARISTSPATSVMNSDADGEFTLQNVPVGEYTVHVSKDGFTADSVVVTVSTNTQTEVLLEIYRIVDTGVLTGTVRDAESDIALRGASASTTPPTTSVITDSAGQFIVNQIFAGDYTVTIRKAGYQDRQVDVHINAGDTTDAIIEMTRDALPGNIAGIVRNSDTQNPVSGARLTTDPATNVITSASDGTFLFEQVTPGSYTIYVTKTGLSRDSVTVNVAAGDTAHAILEMTEIHTTGAIAGQINDSESGNAISGVNISTSPATNAIQSDAGGQFMLADIDVGDYTISLEKSGYQSREITVTVNPNDTTNATIELTPIIVRGNITGTVKNGETNTMIAGARITTDPPSQVAVSDSSGEFQLTQIPTGDYTVQVTKQGFEPDQVSVTVIAGETSEVFLELYEDMTTGMIQGLVQNDETLQPIPNARVTTSPATQVVMTDNNGEFSLPDIPTGNYSVQVTKSGFTSDTLEVNVTGGGTSEITLAISELVTTGTIAGLVQNEDTGAPLAGANITTEPATGAIQSDANGEFSIDDLAEGTYTITVTKSGFLNSEVDVTVPAGDTVDAIIELTPATQVGSITGTVRNGLNQQPIEGSRITTNPPTTMILTDANGEFSLTDIPVGEYTVYTTKNGFSTDSVTVNVGTNAVVNVMLDMFNISNTSSVTGVVKSATTGNPIAGANISTDPPTNAIQTDANGLFALIGIPSDSYTIQVTKTGYINNSVDVSVQPGDTVDTIIELSPSTVTGEIAGIVNDGRTNQPIQGARVTTTPPTEAMLTDINGNFSFPDLEVGQYVVRVTKNGFTEDSLAVTVMANQTADVVFEISELVTDGSIAGIVQHAQTGAPISGVNISTDPPTSAIQTDTNGEFNLNDIAANNYTITASKTGFHERVVSIAVEAGDTTDITLELEPIVQTGTIAGTVTNGDTQSSASDARVTTNPPSGTAISDANGEFSIGDVPVGEYTIIVSKPGFRPDSVAVNLAAGQTVNVHLVLIAPPENSGSLAGVVIDAETNQPVSNATVSTDPATTIQQTDANGEFHVPAIEAGEYTISVGKSGFLTYTGVANVAAGGTTNVQIQLTPSEFTGSITGVVRNPATGNPISDARVTTSPSTEVQLTDANGEFTFADIATGEYEVKVTKNSFTSDSVSVTVASNQTVNVVLEIEQRYTSGTIAGLVQHADTGAPLGNVNITTDPPTNAIQSASDGAFTLSNVNAGDYAITATKSGYNDYTVNIAVQAGDTTNVVLELAPIVQTGTIAGTVINGETQNPVADVRITTNPPSGTTISDASGDFTLADVPVGNYTIVASKSGYRPDSLAINLAAGQTAEVQLVLNSPPIDAGALAGVITDAETGDPVASASISTDPATTVLQSAADGSFTFADLESGEYTLNITKSGYLAESVAVQIQSGDTTNVQVQLDPSTLRGSISGIVRHAVQGTAITDARVTTAPSTQVVLTDGSGEFNYTSIPVGEYEVRVTKNGFTSDTVSVTVNANETAEVVFEIQEAPTTGVIAGLVQHTDTGAPLSGVNISTDPPSSALQTDANGEFIITGVGAQDYTISASKTGFNETSVAIAVQAGDTTHVTMELEPIVQTGVIAGTVTDGETQLAVADARVTTNPPTGTATSDVNGEFALANVPIGQYTVSVGKAGFTPDSVTISVEAGDTVSMQLILNAPSENVGVLAGVVTSAETGDPISNVSVSTDPATTVLQSASDGSFFFSDLDAGDYSITVEKSGFVDKSVSVHINAGDTTNVAIQMTPSVFSGSIAGIVRHADNGTPITDARVTTTPATQVILTDANGEFDLTTVPTGEYLVRVTKSGYTADSVSVTVTANTTSNVVIELTESVTSGVIAGVVNHASTGVPLASVNINTEPPTTALQTDTNGEFIISGVGAGDYTINASKSNYSDYSVSVAVRAGDTTSVVLELEPIVQTGTISGVVVNGDTQNPVADARVTTNPASGTAISDANGEFSLQDVPIGTYTVSVSKAGYRPDSLTISVAAGQEVTVQLVLNAPPIDAGTLIGSITDSESGDPVENASISTTPATTVLQSAADGGFTFANLEAGEYSITITKAGYVEKSASVQIMAGDTTNMSVQIDPSTSTGSIAGIVQHTADGTSIQNARVTTTPATEVILTDANGEFTFDSVPVGEYEVRVTKNGFTSDTVSVSVTNNHTSNITFEIQEVVTKGVLTGIVQRGDTGAPISGVNVSTDPPTSAIQTDANGEFSLGQINAGDYRIFLSKSGFEDDSVSVSVTAGDTTNVTLELAPVVQTGGITGIVLNGENQAPVSDARVTTNPPSGSALSDANGEFSLSNIPIGTYTVYASKAGLRPDSLNITVQPGQTVDVQLVLDAPQVNAGSLAGVITSAETGSPISNASISTDPATTMIQSGADGSFLFADIDAGEYTLTVTKSGYVTRDVAVQVTAGDTTNVQIQLSSALVTGVIAGTVQHNPNGLPVSEARVTTDPSTDVVMSDTSGAFTFSGIETGTYTVVVTKSGYTSDEISVTVQANDTAHVTLEISELATLGSIHGTVKNSETGSVVTGANISTDPATTSLQTDAQGEFWVEDIEEGSYTITVEKSGFTARDVTINVNGGDTTDVVIEITPSVQRGSIAGLISDSESGAPLSNVSISTDPPTQAIQSAGDGTYGLYAIPTGDYSITATKSGYTSVTISVNVSVGDTTVANIDMTPAVQRGTITGTVRDRDGGTALADVRITTDPPSTTAMTDGSGQFTLSNLPVGDYEVLGTKNGFTGDSVTVAVSAGDTVDILLELAAETTTGSIAGLVQHAETGAPITGASVSTDPATSVIQSDASGEFHLNNIPAGEYAITVTKTNFVEQTINVTVNAGDTVQAVVDLSPSVTTGTITGLIRNAVSLDSIADSRIVTDPATRVVLSDANGLFTISNVPVGEYLVRATKSNYLADSVSVSVTAGDTTATTLELYDINDTGVISGLVRNATTGIAVFEASITTSPPTSAILTDSTGRFTLSRLIPNDYTITVEKNGYDIKSVDVHVSAGDTTEATILLNSSNNAPNAPTNPTPSDGATDQETNLTLSWSASDPDGDVLVYDVYLYEDGESETTIATDHTEESIDVTDLAFNTTYNWQVVAIDDEGSETSSAVWQFTTVQLSDNPIVFASNRSGNYEIYSTTVTGNPDSTVALTNNSSRDWWPRLSPVVRQDTRPIGFVTDRDIDPQIYTMDGDGTNLYQVTTTPVTGFNNSGFGVSWAPDGTQFIYGNYDRLYRIDSDGSNLTELAIAPVDRNFRELDWSPTGNQIVALTIGQDRYDAEIYLMDSDGSNMTELYGNEAGASGHPVFSPNGDAVLFFQDVSGYESGSGGMSDTHLLLVTTDGADTTDLSINKPAGTNDLYPRYSPDGTKIIFTNAPNYNNSGSSDIYIMDPDGSNRELLIEDGIMPDWR